MSADREFGWRTMKLANWVFGDLTGDTVFQVMRMACCAAGVLIGFLVVALLPEAVSYAVLAFCVASMAWILAIILVRRRAANRNG